MNRFIFLIIIFLTFSCGEKQNEAKIEVVKEKIIKEFGFTLNNFNVKKDTIESGDSFGLILEKNNLFYPKIYNIVQETKKVFDVRNSMNSKNSFGETYLKSLSTFIIS